MHPIDRVARSNRWSGRHPSDKLVLGGGLLLLSLALPPLPGSGLVLAAAVGSAVAGARIRLGDCLRVLAVPAAFLAGGALVLMVSLRFDVGGPSIAVSPAGARTAAEASLRALSATASLTLIVLTTPLPDLIGGLRRLRVPAPLVDIALLVYRLSALVFVVAETARASQANRLGYVTLRRSLRSTGLLAAGLLPRLFERASRLQAGLAARAYDGELRTLPSPVAAPSFRFVVGAVALQATIAAATLAGEAILGAAP